jgi:hypothetical protein
VSCILPLYHRNTPVRLSTSTYPFVSKYYPALGLWIYVLIYIDLFFVSRGLIHSKGARTSAASTPIIDFFFGGGGGLLLYTAYRFYVGGGGVGSIPRAGRPVVAGLPGPPGPAGHGRPPVRRQAFPHWAETAITKHHKSILAFNMGSASLKRVPSVPNILVRFFAKATRGRRKESIVPGVAPIPSFAPVHRLYKIKHFDAWKDSPTRPKTSGSVKKRFLVPKLTT